MPQPHFDSNDDDPTCLTNYISLLRIRKWRLWAFNIRTNHVHTVVTANCRAWQVLNALKANATRSLREAGCWRSQHCPWVRRGSKRRLWTEKELLDAIAYLLYDQGEPFAVECELSGAR